VFISTCFITLDKESVEDEAITSTKCEKAYQFHSPEKNLFFAIFLSSKKSIFIIKKVN